jgi:large subunit ribosomal protein L10
MASAKVLESKKAVVSEIEDLIKNSESVIIFSYQGLSVSDLSKLRRELKEKDGEVRVFKNTLVKRALDDLKIDLDGFLEGPNAIMFGHELLEPIKVLSKFAKENDKAEIRVGIISGSPADLKTINEYATIPSREGLLTMLAGGMIQYVRDLAIGLNLYAEQLEK